MSSKINEIEDQVKILTLQTRKLSAGQLFKQREQLDYDIEKMKNNLSTFGTYLPSVRLEEYDKEEVIKKSTVNLKA